jgi:hypothetical protein
MRGGAEDAGGKGEEKLSVLCASEVISFLLRVRRATSVWVDTPSQ